MSTSIESVEELLTRIEARVARMEELAQISHMDYDQLADDYAAALAFIKDVWLNKYPTKPRVIDHENRWENEDYGT